MFSIINHLESFVMFEFKSSFPQNSDNVSFKMKQAALHFRKCGQQQFLRESFMNVVPMNYEHQELRQKELKVLSWDLG